MTDDAEPAYDKLYNWARAKVDSRICMAISRDPDFWMTPFLAHRLDLPSMMASMITKEEIDTDILVVKTEDSFLVDCGLATTWNLLEEGFSFEDRLVHTVRTAQGSEFAGGYLVAKDSEKSKFAHDLLGQIMLKNIESAQREMIQKTMPEYLKWRDRFIEAEPKVYVLNYSRRVEIPDSASLEVGSEDSRRTKSMS